MTTKKKIVPRRSPTPELLDGEPPYCETVRVKNITVSIDDDLHRRARVRAAEKGTSVSAVVRAFLTEFAGQESDYERRERLQRQTLAAIKSFRVGDRLSRDEVHDRALR